ncbi:chitinase A1 [Penicillium waksmanii]|uniref:chitinase A1 n=1 Tax=Penicillium waksmanii TaxID=69791 RepID=UPI002546F3AA|nr:chitinase A1 [Penicillium waksmanii]KAJ5965824.1 chitinase A1 [Penicillium waksmanii]
MDVDSSQSCISAIPAFMYNRKFFPDEDLKGRHIPGIFYNIMKYFKQEGLGSGPFTGTFREFTITDENGQNVDYDDSGPRSATRSLKSLESWLA